MGTTQNAIAAKTKEIAVTRSEVELRHIAGERNIAIRRSVFPNISNVFAKLAVYGFTSRSAKARDVAILARNALGAPYKLGSLPTEAPAIFDCSSFVKWIYEQFGIWIPRVSYEQWHFGRKLREGESFRVGDLVFRRGARPRYDQWCPGGVGHVGIVVAGANLPEDAVRVVHAASEGRGVVEEDLDAFQNSGKPNSSPWRGAARIVEDFNDMLVVEITSRVRESLRERILRTEDLEEWLNEA